MYCSAHLEGLKPGLESGFWKMGGEFRLLCLTFALEIRTGDLSVLHSRFCSMDVLISSNWWQELYWRKSLKRVMG